MTQLTSPFDLSKDEIKTLATLAIAAKQKAYCANVEIASTPVGICAERCALAPIIASVTRPFPPDRDHANIPLIRAVAVATNIDPPASPCGMCRQFMREFLDKDVKVWMYGKYGFVEDVDDDERDERDDQAPQAKIDASGSNSNSGSKKRTNGAIVLTMEELLPMSFGPNDMQRNEQKPTSTFG